MKLLDYSIQLSMLRSLLNKRLINDSEYIKVKKKLMEDYGIVSDITTWKKQYLYCIIDTIEEYGGETYEKSWNYKSKS